MIQLTLVKGQSNNIFQTSFKRLLDIFRAFPRVASIKILLANKKKRKKRKRRKKERTSKDSSRASRTFPTDAPPDCGMSSVARGEPGSPPPSLPPAARRRGDSARSAVACSAVAAASVATRTRNNAQETYVPSTVLRAWRRRLCRRYVSERTQEKQLSSWRPVVSISRC